MGRTRHAAAPLVAKCAVASLLALASVGPRAASAQTADRSSRGSGQEETSSDVASGPERLGPDPNGVPVHLDSNAPATWFYYKASEPALRAAAENGQDVSASPYLPLCASPCDVTLKPGAYHIALAGGDAKPTEAPGWVVVGGATTTVNGNFADRRWLRTIGWVALPVLAVAGVAMMVGAAEWSHSVDQQCAMPGDPGAQADAAVACNRSHEGPNALLSAAFVTAISSVPIGIFLGTRSDSAEVVVVPGAASAPWSSMTWPTVHVGEMRERGGGTPGLSVQVRF
jgi:hypothetical protein